MGAARCIKKDALLTWLEEVGKSRLVLAPRAQGKSTAFLPFDPAKGISLSGLATSSPKQALIPRHEALLEFRYTKTDQVPAQTGLAVRELIPNQPTLVFGARPCDARGFTVLDRVYDAGAKRDVYYCARRDKTIVATVACTEPADTCFCNRVGGGPGDSAGSDILVTELDQLYVLEAVTQRGEAFLLEQKLPDATELADKAQAARAAVRAAMPEGDSLLGAPDKVGALFDEMPFWDGVAAKCLSCGACSYLCPTCYCFNITDESKGGQGVRVRTWDNCMSFQFTLEGSGHNPRATKSQRMRNRVGHKFCYYPTLHDGALSCVGCGRCIAHCPVSMDIRRIVSKALTYEKAAKEHSNV
ncbi:MAG: 4Fe-4S dicluster domain-containing protein [Humidesulfovibrio sp.]|nr:4Fe-4S dicluster domain-containing protein [Humidesulfovibrio sp.]